MIRLTMEATMPDELLQHFLQHVRNFDLLHDPKRDGKVHLAIGVEAPDMKASTVQQIFSSVRPPFDQKIIMQGKAEA